MSESRKSHVDELALEMQKKGEVGQLSLFAFQITVEKNLLIPNPDPENLASRSEFLMTENLENFPVGKKIESVFTQRILQQLYSLYSWASMKDFQATEEAFCPQKKRTSRTTIHEIFNFSLFFGPDACVEILPLPGRGPGSPWPRCRTRTPAASTTPPPGPCCSSVKIHKMV
jgi:hypothetical protein